MIVLEKPYVSRQLAETLKRLRVPVLANGCAEQAGAELNIVDEKAFIEMVSREKDPLLLTNSEDSIKWIEDNLQFTGLPGKIDLLKDKLRFRRMLEAEYPGLFFAGISFDDLKSLDVAAIEKPFVIKPAVGFFSIAVYRVGSDEEWPRVLEAIENDIEKIRGLYPTQVLDPGRFIIEGNIEGDEFAVDLYYDEEGRPVILNILAHLFASGSDVSDRTYITSARIVADFSKLFYGHLARIGALAGLRNFPMHIEFRVDGGRVMPIEANPLRFAAWGTTDIAAYAWGIDTAEYFFRKRVPAWEEIFEGKEDRVYSIFVAGIPGDIPAGEIAGIDYDRFAASFSRVLELRRIDYRRYHVFAFVFTETGPESRGEIERMLEADLGEFVIRK